MVGTQTPEPADTSPDLINTIDLLNEDEQPQVSDDPTDHLQGVTGSKTNSWFSIKARHPLSDTRGRAAIHLTSAVAGRSIPRGTSLAAVQRSRRRARGAVRPGEARQVLG